MKRLHVILLILAIQGPLFIYAKNHLDAVVNAFERALSEIKFKPEAELQDSATSPDGTWVAERYLEFYPQDTAVQLSLHHPSESSDYIPFKSVGDDALFTWLDDTNLLIAALEGNNQQTKPDGEFSEATRPKEFNGVKLHYGFYSYDPDKPRIEGKQKIFTKKAYFTYNFIDGHEGGEPSNGCYLRMTASDKDYVSNLYLQFSAVKLYPHNEWNHKAENTFYVNISTGEEVKKSLGHVTGGKVENFSPDVGKALMGREFKHITAPNGSPAPMWDIVYNFPNQKALQTIINKIKKEGLVVRVGFWLDNAEVIYSSDAPYDTSAIEGFEDCIARNNIFSSPPQ